MPDIKPPSVEYPARVFFYTREPQVLLDGGYDTIVVEKRRSAAADWVQVPSVAIPIKANTYNYGYLDPLSKVGFEYRAVLVNAANRGTPPDVPQPIQRAVDATYEYVMTIKELKEIYFWGQDKGFITDDGVFQPDYTFAHAIRYGIAKVERALDLKLLPTRIVEFHDLIPEGGRGYIQLCADEHPLVEVESLTLTRSGQEYVFPSSWLNVNKDTGAINVVPDGTGFSPTVVGFPGGRSYIPSAYKLTYVAGFPLGELPNDLKEVVGKEAAFGPLNVAGDLIGGAGLAGTSLSMDGLSESVTTTNSSTNAGFGARLIQYEKELRETYKKLKAYYKGIRLQVS